MANEANNAEEQLKQYAAERRQHVPPEIHPATRNLLQGEVRRVYGGPEVERRTRTRLRWMQAFVGLAIAAAIPLFFLPRNPKENVQETAPSKPGEVALPTEQKRGEAPIVLSDTKEPVAPVVVAEPPPAASAPQPELARSAVRSRGVEAQPEQRKAVVKDEAVTATAAIAAAADNFSLANNVSNQPILNRFRFEQTGARVKITEADGSVYPGRVISQQNGNDVFYVAGVSRSLQQAVTVTGQVMRASLASARQRQQRPEEQESRLIQNTLSNVRADINADDVRVQGQATVGNSQYKVDAQLTPGP
jgi:hypothetical protein